MAEERCKYTEVRIRTLLPPVISEIGRFLAWGTLAGPLPARRECLACHVPRGSPTHILLHYDFLATAMR